MSLAWTWKLQESLLRTVFGSEFQTAGAEHWKVRFANVVVVKGWWRTIVVDRRLWPCSRSWIRSCRYDGVEVLRTSNVITLACPPIGLHCLALDRIHSLSSTCSCSPELLCTHLFSLIHLLARTVSNSLKLSLTHLPARWLALAHFLSRTCSPGAVKPFSFQ